MPTKLLLTLIRVLLTYELCTYNVFRRRRFRPYLLRVRTGTSTNHFTNLGRYEMTSKNIIYRVVSSNGISILRTCQTEEEAINFSKKFEGSKIVKVKVPNGTHRKYAI